MATIWAAFVKFGQIFIPKFGHPASGYIFRFQMEEENTKKKFNFFSSTFALHHADDAFRSNRKAYQ